MKAASRKRTIRGRLPVTGYATSRTPKPSDGRALRARLKRERVARAALALMSIAPTLARDVLRLREALREIVDDAREGSVACCEETARRALAESEKEWTE